MSEGTHVDDVGILRVHQNPGDVSGVVETQMGPALSAIGRFVDSVAKRDAVAQIGLPGADIHHLGVGRCKRQITDRGDRLIVEDGLEGQSAVNRLPDTTRSRADINDVGISGDPFDIGHPAAHVDRSDRPPLEMVKRSGLFVCGVGYYRRDDAEKSQSRYPVRKLSRSGVCNSHRILLLNQQKMEHRS